MVSVQKERLKVPPGFGLLHPSCFYVNGGVVFFGCGGKLEEINILSRRREPRVGIVLI